MYLEKLELFGFKSFANKTILQFTPGITCIVGPNGSGKSNILDAIRWVTGEQSLKILRGKKSADIIFSGSTKKTRSNMVEVFLYLNNEDRRMGIDYTNLVISRRLFHNGSHEYFINKKRVLLQDIILLLAQANFGQKSYGTISQGMTDYILTCSLKDRKDFFNEAAGVKHYQIKREKALHKLERSQENLNQGEMMLAEISPHLRSLTRQVNRLKKREEVEKELFDLQKKYYSHFWQEIEKEFQEKGESYQQWNKKHQDQIKIVNVLKKKLSQIVIEGVRDELAEKLQQEYEQVVKVKNELLTQQAILRGKIEIEKTKIEEGLSKNENNISHGKIRTLIKRLKNIAKNQQEIEDKIKKIQNVEDLINIKERVKSIGQKINQLISEFKGEQSVKVKNDILINLKKENENLIQKVNKFENKIQEIKDKISQHRQEELGKRKELFELQKKYQTEQEKLDRIVFQKNEIDVELSRIKTKKEDLEEEMKREVQNHYSIIKNFSSIRDNEKINKEELRNIIDKLKYRLELIGGIDPEITKEYEETKERFDFLTSQIADLNKTISSLNKLAKELEEIIKKQFNLALKEINSKFNEYFKILFTGGKAQLILRQETELPFNLTLGKGGYEGVDETKEEINEDKKTTITGLEIQAVPPRKKIKSINALSGGERALTSLALICAIISYNPPPFVILDEVDAALDEANSQKFVSILEQLAHQTQFIVITHNRIIMEKAKILYGITLDKDGTSKILSINLEEAKKEVGE